MSEMTTRRSMWRERMDWLYENGGHAIGLALVALCAARAVVCGWRST